MIIVKVQGGLGNQLMQYSFGRVLHLLYNKEVAYDTTFFKAETKYTERPYHLDHFNLDVRIATDEEIQKTKYPLGVLSKVLDKGYRFMNKYFWKRYYVGYNPTLIPMLKKKDSYYIEGFWQTYHYYKDALVPLSKEITLKDTTRIEKFKQEVSFDSKVSVSLHVRRGDFLKKNAGTKALSQDYYKQAVPLFESFVPNPTYFVFSDDIAWVKDEMGYLFQDVVYVSSYGLSDREEFSLLKECHHAILSNSTFAWFSTLLTNTDKKVVVFSHEWENPYLNIDKEICPPTWHGI